jgi:hypothetical protein
MTDELHAKALALPAAERAELAYALLESLDEEPGAEAARREERGERDLVDGAEGKLGGKPRLVLVG